MDEPDPIAELAAQLEVLRGRWARSQGEIGALREQFKTEFGQVTVLLVAVKRLSKRLNEVLEKGQLAPPPAPWWGTDANETRSMLAELRHWVDDFARRQYPAYMGRLRPC